MSADSPPASERPARRRKRRPRRLKTRASKMGSDSPHLAAPCATPIIAKEISRGRAITDYASFSASTSFVIAARSGSDAIILRSLRGIPLRRNSLILTITSPRAKLPNSGRKRPSRRASRVQKRFLTAIFFHRSRRAIFERGATRSAEGLGRNEPDWPFATLASCQYALAPYEVKECSLLWLGDVREAEVIFVNQHLSAP
jgi:hypothetical protein